MDVSESKSSDQTLFQKSNLEDSDALKYIMSRRNMNNVSSNASQILELCSRQPTPFSMLNGSIVTSSAPSDTLNGVNGNNFPLSPTTPLSAPHSATSFSSFPRFPNPVSHDDSGIYMRLNTNNILQPRINPSTRRTRHFVPNERKDEYYWQKRRKNNEAARKSREKRRTIDSVLEEKVLILSHENKVLRNELYALKVKYGEIDADSNRDKEDSAVHNKVKPIALPCSSNSKHEPSCSCSCTSPPVPSSPSLPHTAITLPKVNVILESDKVTNDASSAKLVLSNLASGTLILSPINLSCKAKAVVEQTQVDGVAENSVLAPTTKPEEIKEVEAANTLASLFRCNDSMNDVTMNDVTVEESRHVIRASCSSSSSDSSESFQVDVKKTHTLPCKLRYKNFKVDGINDQQPACVALSK